jgi:hypothetical protein
MPMFLVMFMCLMVVAGWDGLTQRGWCLRRFFWS